PSIATLTSRRQTRYISPLLWPWWIASSKRQIRQACRAKLEHLSVPRGHRIPSPPPEASARPLPNDPLERRLLDSMPLARALYVTCTALCLVNYLGTKNPWP